MQTLTSLFVVALASLAATGCQNYIFSPPARSAPLETAATLPIGDTGVQLEGGVHGAVFGVSAQSGTIRVRRGIAEHTDISVEGTVLHINGDTLANVHPNAYSGRVGVKHRVLPYLAFTGGVGGGGSAGGGFVSPDLGVILAWENKYVVPFLSFRGTLSQPVGARAVDTSRPDEPLGTHVFTPNLTWIGGGTAGARVPIGDSNARGEVRASLLGGVSFTHLADVNDKETVMSITGGAEIMF